MRVNGAVAAGRMLAVGPESPHAARVNLELMRRNYANRTLDPADLHADPFVQFDGWMREAIAAQLLEPNAMSLATVSAGGAPSLRTVLLKGFDARGLVFYTSYTSGKARDLAVNPAVALLFPWLPLERQVSVTGRAEKISTAESLKYFLSRPRESQIGAWASRQSEIITNRSLLEAKFAEMKTRFMSGEVPLPGFWGGYRVTPDTFEFWQGRPNRLHDRFRYTRQAGGAWQIERLMP